MNINPSNNNINFGWSCETHKKIMDTALKDMPQFEQHKDLMTDYVQRPDHDDIGFMANKHFYFGDKIDLSTKKENAPVEKSTKNGLMNAFSKIFNTNGVSFMDYNGRNNAKAAFEDELFNMDYAQSDGDEDWGLQSAARAAHFLQDITQPQHIENTTVLGKAADLKIHNDFEDKCTELTDTFAKNYLEENQNKEKDILSAPRNCTRLFNESFNATKDLDKITRENEKNWGEIGQQQFNLAVQATKELMQNVSDVMGL